MEFLGEEIVIKKLKIDKSQREEDVFNNSNMPHEKDGYAKFEIIKVGRNQNLYKVGDRCLINQNGLGKEITVEGSPPMIDQYALMNHTRIFCKINE